MIRKSSRDSFSGSPGSRKSGRSRLFFSLCGLLLFVVIGLVDGWFVRREAVAQDKGPPKGPSQGETTAGQKVRPDAKIIDAEDPRQPQTIRKEGKPARVRPEVRRLIRRLLSKSSSEQKSAERSLRKMGAAAIPDLRAWLRQFRIESSRVELLLREMVADVLDTELPPTVVSRDFSAAEYFERKYRQAQEHLQYGRYEKARKIAEAIMELDEDSPMRFLCRRLIRRATEQKVREKLEPTIDVGALVYEIGEKPEVVFRLHNRTDARARFDVEDGLIGELMITVERRYFDGHKDDRDRQPLRIRQRRASVILQPGQAWEYKIPYDIPKNLPIENTVARIQFQAVFRPKMWEIEGERDGNIPLRTVRNEFWVIPPGKKRKLEDPLKRLSIALVFDSPEDLLVAGWLCAWGGETDAELNGKLIDELVKALPDLGGKYQVFARQVLYHATGQTIKKSEDWARWWAKTKALREAEKASPKPESKGNAEAVLGTR